MYNQNLDVIEENDEEMTNRVNTDNNIINNNQNDVIEKLNFQLDLANRKIKNNERTIEKLTSLQNDYEKKLSTITTEFRNKEQTLREKYKSKEDALENEQRNYELNFEREISVLKDENVKLKNQLFEYETEINKHKAQIKSIEHNNKIKENDFQNLLKEKELKIIELEKKMESIQSEKSEKYQNLVKKNSELLLQLKELRMENTVLSNANLKKNSFNIKLKQLNTDDTKLKNDNKNLNLIKNVKKEINDANASLNYYDDSNELNHTSQISPYDLLKMKDLREKIQQLHHETVQLTRELSLKYEECDALNDEVARQRIIIQNLKEKEKTNNIEQNISIMNIKNKRNSEYEEKEKENNLKLNNLEMLVNNYGNTLIELREEYEKTLINHQREIQDLNINFENKVHELVKENNDLKRIINENNNFNNYNNNDNNNINNLNFRYNSYIPSNENEIYDNYKYLNENNQGISVQLQNLNDMNDKIQYLKKRIQNITNKF